MLNWRLANEDNDEEDNIDEDYYFSWDCIYNYPEAGALYSDYGNPEAGAQLEEFCLAVLTENGCGEKIK